MAPEPKASGSVNKYDQDGTEEVKKVLAQIRGYEHRYRLELQDKLSTKEKLDLKLAKQKNILDKFQSDRLHLISQTFTSEQAKRKEIENIENFVDYIREKAFLESEVKNIRSEMKELDKRSKNVEREIKKRTIESNFKKAKMTGFDPTSEHRSEATVNTLENKLSQARRVLNEIIMVCKEYRREIDDCLRERLEFRTILDSVTSKLKNGKGCMLDMIEQAAVATAKRESARERLRKLIAEHKKVTSTQAYMFREMHSSINVLIDRAMFQSVKIQRRVMEGLEARRQLTALIRRQDFENQILKTKLLFNSLKHLYQIDSYKDIGKKYNESDELIIGLLNYSGSTFVSSDKQHNFNAISQFNCDVAKQATRDIVQNEYKMLLETESRHTALSEEVENLSKKVEYAKTLKEFVALRLNMMFVKANCNYHRYTCFLGDNSHIHADNFHMMIKEIERRMVHLIGLLFMAERSSTKESLPLKRYLLYLPHGEENVHVKMRCFGVGVRTPCPVCAEAEHFGLRKEAKDKVERFNKMRDEFLLKVDSEGIRNHLHSVSNCHLPGSRRLLQQRFLKLGY